MEGTSLWSWRGSLSAGARVRVGPNTSARLAEPILFSSAYCETLCGGGKPGNPARPSQTDCLHCGPSQTDCLHCGPSQTDCLHCGPSQTDCLHCRPSQTDCLHCGPSQTDCLHCGPSQTDCLHCRHSASTHWYRKLKMYRMTTTIAGCNLFTVSLMASIRLRRSSFPGVHVCRSRGTGVFQTYAHTVDHTPFPPATYECSR